MGRGITDQRSLVYVDPVTAALTQSLTAVEAARTKVAREGWPVLEGVHTPADLAEWDARRSERAAIMAALVDEPAYTRTEFASSVMASWSRCMLASPRTYASSLDFNLLTPAEMERWRELARRDATYEHSCVLGGSPVTFGIEIEFVGDLNKVAAALYEVGLATEPTVSTDNRPRGWTVKPDPTVEPFGGEVVSPVMVDLEECWKALERVCAILRASGATVNRSCGLHVHLGADRLGDDVASYLRLYLLNRSFEDLIYRLAAAGGEMRHRGLAYDRPIARRGYRAFVRSVGEFRRQIEAGYADAINFMNVGTIKNTIEFRFANGTLDPLQIQALVVLYTGMLEAARRSNLQLTDRPAAPLGTYAGRTSNADDDRLLRDFCDVVFPTNNRAKLHTLWLYERSRWQSEPALELAALDKAHREVLAPVFQRLALVA